MATDKQMNRQVSRSSAGDYQADEQAGVAPLSCRLSSRSGGRCRAAQLEIIKQKNRQVSRGSVGDYKQMSRKVSRGSAVDYQADEQAGVTRLRWSQSSRKAGRCPAAQLVYIKKMSRQVWRGSVFDYQPDEQAGVEGLTWRLSSR